MEKESVEKNFSTVPQIEGDFIWAEDKKSFTFKPSRNLSFGTNFKIAIKKGTKDEQGKYLPEDVIFYFKTIGRVWASFSPFNGANGTNIKTSIKVYFDQPVNQESAKERFKIEPQVNGSFSFSLPLLLVEAFNLFNLGDESVVEKRRGTDVLRTGCRIGRILIERYPIVNPSHVGVPLMVTNATNIHTSTFIFP